MSQVEEKMLDILAAKLKEAERTHTPIEQLHHYAEGLSIDDAYKIQLRNIELELSEGKVITGKKIGLTSAAMQNLLGVDQPDYGHLLDSMEIHTSETPFDSILQARVEGEILFILKEDLSGGQVTVEDVVKATDYVVGGIEVVGSRVANWKIGIIDTVADNASCGQYILGKKRLKLNEFDRIKEGMSLYKNGELINQGTGAAVLGDPAYCVAWLANMMHKYGVTLKAGEVILSGALSAMIPVAKGDAIKASFDSLGDVDLQFV